MVSTREQEIAQRRPCPRCDYDLSGEIDSWKDACPLEGRCPECGLEFEWRNILNPRLAVPRWSFEHAPARPWPLVKTYVQTLLMTLRPWRLWREMRMEHEVRWWRLANLYLTQLLLMHLFWVSKAAFEVIQYMIRRPDWAPAPGGAKGGPGPTARNLIDAIAWPYDFQTGYSNAFVPAGNVLGFVLVVTLFTGSASASTLLCYTILRQSRPRANHVLRIATYAVPPFIALMIAWFAVNHALLVLPVELATWLFALVMIACITVPTTLWLRIAFQHYLQLPGAGIVAVINTVIAVMVVFVMALALDS